MRAEDFSIFMIIYVYISYGLNPELKLEKLTNLQEKQQLLKEWVQKNENPEAIETSLEVSREQSGELERGKELLTISEMQQRGFSQFLIVIIKVCFS